MEINWNGSYLWLDFALDILLFAFLVFFYLKNKKMRAMLCGITKMRRGEGIKGTADDQIPGTIPLSGIFHIPIHHITFITSAVERSSELSNLYLNKIYFDNDHPATIFVDQKELYETLKDKFFIPINDGENVITYDFTTYLFSGCTIPDSGYIHIFS